VDVVGDLTVGGITNVKTVIQAKRFKNVIGSKIIRELRGSAELTKRGLIITTSHFSKDAIEEADQVNKMPISLINGERLVDLLVEHEVGVKKTNIEIITLDDTYLNQTNAESYLGRKIEDRSLALWPLPGGADQYFASLLKFLEFVEEKSPNQKEATAWFIDSFDSVESEKTAKGYTNVPRSMGLIEVHDGRFVLSKLGQELIKNRTERKLLEVLEENIVGVSEILAALREESLSERQIWQYLNDSLDLGWKSYMQIGFRLRWLQGAKAVKKLENGLYGLEKAESD